MPITAILGEQRGDEGKGRFIDEFAGDHDVIARFNGGPNAGHTVVLPDGAEFDLHGLPSGVTHPGKMNVIGNGVVIDPIQLVGEMHKLEAKGIVLGVGSLMISSAAHLILPHHKFADEEREVSVNAQGSTKTGIAPAYADKALREGSRVECITNDSEGIAKRVTASIEAANEIIEQLNHSRTEAGLDTHPIFDVNAEADLYLACAQDIGKFATDTAKYLSRMLRAGKRVLAEGAQGFLLDLDHGMYPAVTSSSTTIGGVMTGLGVPPSYIERVIGVSKATPSHVGGGPFLTEIADQALVAKLRGNSSDVDGEFGKTTGRPRRMGHLDLPGIRRSQMVNGTEEMALTKLDKVPDYGHKVMICVAYKSEGKLLEVAPDSARKIEQSTPIYESLPTWREDISRVRRFKDLPTNAMDYIEYIEGQTGVPITRIGVGPRRDQVIIRD